jgi:hypothetical protein
VLRKRRSLNASSAALGLGMRRSSRFGVHGRGRGVMTCSSCDASVACRRWCTELMPVYGAAHAGCRADVLEARERAERAEARVEELEAKNQACVDRIGVLNGALARAVQHICDANSDHPLVEELDAVIEARWGLPGEGQAASGSGSSSGST